MANWHQFVADDWDDESSFNESLLENIWDNQEELLAGNNYDVYFDQAGHSNSSWAILVDRGIFFPAALIASPATWQWTIRFGRKMSGGSGNDYEVRGRLYDGVIGSAWQEKGPFGNTSWTADSFVFDDTVIRNAALIGEVRLQIEGKINSVWNVQVRNYGEHGPGRLVRL